MKLLAAAVIVIAWLLLAGLLFDRAERAGGMP